MFCMERASVLGLIRLAGREMGRGSECICYGSFGSEWFIGAISQDVTLVPCIHRFLSIGPSDAGISSLLLSQSSVLKEMECLSSPSSRVSLEHTEVSFRIDVPNRLTVPCESNTC